MRVGINGLGRIGRLAIRALQNHPTLELVHVNDVAGDAATHAHLLVFDSVHGVWDVPVAVDGPDLVIKQKSIRVTSARTLEDADFGDCDLVLECTGQFKTVDALAPYLDAGISQVVVSAPIKVPEVLNVVMGVNQTLFSAEKHPIVTLRSSSNTQSVIDAFASGTRIACPFRRPRSSGKISAMAVALPVVVGIREIPHARARRKSL